MIRYIKPLPVSEEMLGAYLEGNLPAEDSLKLEGMLQSNVAFKGFVDEVSGLSADGDSDDVYESLHDEYPSFGEEFELPQIPGVEALLADDVDAVCLDVVDYSSISSDVEDSMIQEWTDSVLETKVGDGDECTGSIARNMCGASGHKNYGYEPNYELEKFDPNIYQGPKRTCAIRCQEIILRDYGIMLSQDELVEYATKNGWFDPDPVTGGTSKYAVGNLLDVCGIKTTRLDNATVYDIIAELRAGHRVIVNVDANELWVKNEKNLFKRLFGEVTNRVNDAVQGVMGVEGANHALIVAGVNVNPKDPSDIHVTLIDSGSGDVCIEYTFKEFQKAWEDGNCRMVSTNVPAPFQYNYVTHQMEPSGFDTPFKPSMADLPTGLDNQFCIANNYLEEYQDYHPMYNDGDNQIMISYANHSKDEDYADSESYSHGCEKDDPLYDNMLHEHSDDGYEAYQTDEYVNEDSSLSNTEENNSGNEDSEGTFNQEETLETQGLEY